MRVYVSYITMVISIFILSACRSTDVRAPTSVIDSLPREWQQSVSSKDDKATDPAWLAPIVTKPLLTLIHSALAMNPELKQQALAVSLAQAQLTSAESQLLPALDLTANQRRQALPNGEPRNTAGIDLTLSYQVDLWGALAANRRASVMNYFSQVAVYSQTRLTLIGDVTTAYYDVLEATQLLKLFALRTQTSAQDLSIIEFGYRRGLNTSLDVYLARNVLENDRARYATQQATLETLQRRLSRLVSHTPTHKLAVNDTFPTNISSVPTGLPTDLLTQHPQVLSSWYQLLSADAEVAFAHRQRFPSLRLSASLSDSPETLDALLRDALGWGVVANITAPLYQGERLAAAEAQADLRAQQAEQRYIATVFDTAMRVENRLSDEASLQTRFVATQAAKENAEQAEVLSFEQYRKGLVSYTTVLDAKQRAFDAKTSAIQLTKQRLINRLNLHLAVGGQFDAVGIAPVELAVSPTSTTLSE